MTVTMTATEAKAKLLRLLDQVAEGTDIQITRHGRIVARIVPASGPHHLRNSMAGVARSNATDEELFSTGVAWNMQAEESE